MVQGLEGAELVVRNDAGEAVADEGRRSTGTISDPTHLMGTSRDGSSPSGRQTASKLMYAKKMIAVPARRSPPAAGVRAACRAHVARRGDHEAAQARSFTINDRRQRTLLDALTTRSMVSVVTMSTAGRSTIWHAEDCWVALEGDGGEARHVAHVRREGGCG